MCNDRANNITIEEMKIDLSILAMILSESDATNIKQLRKFLKITAK